MPNDNANNMMMYIFKVISLIFNVFVGYVIVAVIAEFAAFGHFFVDFSRGSSKRRRELLHENAQFDPASAATAPHTGVASS